MQTAIAILMALELVKHHDDDRMEHLLRIGVVGMEQPLTVEIESDFYEWPRIKAVVTHGGVVLPLRLQNLLIFKCFELLSPSLDGTDIAEMLVPDATRWLETCFLSSEAETLLIELRRHVTPGLVVDRAGCTAFTPFTLPPAQGDSDV